MKNDKPAFLDPRDYKPAAAPDPCHCSASDNSYPQDIHTPQSLDLSVAEIVHANILLRDALADLSAAADSFEESQTALIAALQGLRKVL